VIRKKAQWRNQNILHPTRVQVTQMIKDVRLQPRHMWGTTTALKDQVPFGNVRGFCHQSRRFFELLLVITGFRHAAGNTVRRHHKTLRALFHFPYTIRTGFDEERVVIKNPEFLYFRSALAHVRLCRGNVLAILPTSRVTAVCSGNERQSSFDTVVSHRSESVQQ
jgi:hypothetical protein